MARQMSELGTFSITQYLDLDYWGFVDDSNKDTFAKIMGDGDVEALTDHLITLLEAEGWQVEECYSIIHDKDSRHVWDESLLSMVLELKKPHIHASFKFVKGHNTGANIGAISKALGLEPQFVEKPKPGRYSWDNQLSYLVHAKDKDKAAYSPESVYTAKGKDYIAIYHESKDRWERGAIKKANKQTKEDVEWLEAQVLVGAVRRSQVLLTDEYYRIYSQHKRRIDDAFDTYVQRKMYKALEKLEKGEFRTSVYYIMGASGSGKTSFAKELIKSVTAEAKEELGEDWFTSWTASTNPVDDYAGEEILMMDDVRGSSMRADDWLKLLDPWNASPSSARYKNRLVVPRVIIITATMQPYEFFYYSKGVGRGEGQAEAVDQFLRRLMATVKVFNLDEVMILRPEPVLEGEGPVFHPVGSDSDGVIKVPSSYKLEAEAHDFVDTETFEPFNIAIVDSRTRIPIERALDVLTSEIVGNNNLTNE